MSFAPFDVPTSDDYSFITPLKAYKSAEELRTSTTTFSDDADLVIPGRANAVYSVTLSLRVTGAGSATLGDILLRFTFPTGTGAALNIGYTGLQPGVAYGVATGGSVNAVDWYDTASPSTATSMGTVLTNYNKIIGVGTWWVGAINGNLRLQWAQRVSTATSTKLGIGSSLTGVRMA